MRWKLWMTIILESTSKNRNMNYQRIVKYQSPLDSLSNFIILLNVNLNHKNEVFLNKAYIEKKKYDSLAIKIIRGLDIHFRDYPLVRTARSKISQKELAKIAKDLSIYDFVKTNREWILKINEKLVDKAIYRDNVAYKIVDYKNRAIIYNYVEEFKKENAKHEITNFNFDFNNSNKLKLRIFNVGQANCSCLYVDKNIHTLFDIGDMHRNYSLSKTIKEADNFDIIISHFDNDHINASKRLFKKAKNNVTLYFPSWEPVKNLNTMAQFLLLGACISNYNLVPLDLNSSQKNNVRGVDVFQGVLQTKNALKLSERNARCLISQINHGEESILIPGDALYDNFPIAFKPTKMIIPHHGCYYDRRIPLSQINIEKLNETFVFCGPSRKYHHPNVTHIGRFFKNSKGKVLRFKNKNLSQNVIYDGMHSINPRKDFTKQIEFNYYDWKF